MVMVRVKKTCEHTLGLSVLKLPVTALNHVPRLIPAVSQDLTTYDYIVQEQRKERERREQRRKLEKVCARTGSCALCCVHAMLLLCWHKPWVVAQTMSWIVHV